MIQLQVLNYLLDTKDSSFLLMNNLTEDFFSDYKDEFNWIKTHYEDYGVLPDKVSFVGKFPYFDVIEVHETPKYLLDALYEDKNRRELTLTFNKIRECLNNGDTEKALTVYRESVERMAEAVHVDSFDLFSDTSRYDAYVERATDLSKYYVTTGFKELDDIIGGWDREEELATIVARTNQGKSWLLLKSALSAAKVGLKVGLYSGEMSERKVGYRADTLLSGISNKAIIQGNLAVQNEYKKFIDELSHGKIKGSLKILTPSMISGPAGVTALRAFIEKENLDMLCIDQHSLLEDDRHSKNPFERASNISKDLKNLQVMKKIPIVSVCQQNRSSTENGVDTTHIAQSDRIGQDSTIVIFFEQNDGVLKLNLTKSRDSENGKTLEYVIDFDKGVFEYMPHLEDAKGGEDSDALKHEFEDGQDVF